MITHCAAWTCNALRGELHDSLFRGSVLHPDCRERNSWGLFSPSEIGSRTRKSTSITLSPQDGCASNPGLMFLGPDPEETIPKKEAAPSGGPPHWILTQDLAAGCVLGPPPREGCYMSRDLDSVSA